MNLSATASKDVANRRPGGPSEISRWCQPPENTASRRSPRQGRRNGAGPSAPAGARRICVSVRWLAPPANFLQPSGLRFAARAIAFPHSKAMASKGAANRSPGGPSEISRWCQPPDEMGPRRSPRQGRRNGAGPSAPAGARRICVSVRWLAPPANFLQPFGLRFAARAIAFPHSKAMASKGAANRRPGGPSKISRWCQPPETTASRRSPRQGRWNVAGPSAPAGWHL